MQITSTNFSQYGVDADKLFSPCTNLSVFEKVMLDCYTRGGNLKNALSCYYSGDFSTGHKTESSFGNTSYNQRIGYNQSVAKKSWAFHPLEKTLGRRIHHKGSLLVSLPFTLNMPCVALF